MGAETAATRKDRFDLLYGSYAAAHTRFVENAYKITAMMLVILGWLLGSDTARYVIQSDPAVFVVCMTVIILAALSIIIAFRRVKKLSSQIRAKLNELAYVDASYYDQHQLPRSLVVAAIGLNIAICAFIMFLLVRFQYW